ncbi:PQQ-binding-like beta-propeller repeat protein [Fontisphaera persica]|uniref:outer membrane protein assembly factor BamB family protein n=1 Tax=Fontisphaera persica TaxID=2974023 RepID=UPI0024C03740|nr:PQQ-binding-like beta-propeller repeat protein [Fontisphaera persica]WCJ58731.1 PQQ-binding-like beta-propeller repeat protein [Fontisphaera persica]
MSHRYMLFVRRCRLNVVTGMLLALGAMSLPAAAPGEILWTFPVGVKIQSSAALGPDGTLYFGADNGALYALRPDGQKKWEFRAAGALAATPVVGPEGTIYLAGTDRLIYALLPDGREKWRVMPGSGYVSSPALGPQGMLYAGSVFGTLFAIEPAGFRKWEFPANGNIVSSPAISAAGVIYFGSYDTNFYAVNPDGSRRWYVDTGDKIGSSPAIDAQGNVYFGSNDQYLHAVSPFGERLWEVRTGGPVRGSPVIATNGIVIFGSDDRKLRAVSQEARVLWEFATEGWIRSTPALAADGSIYFGSYDGRFYALDAQGRKKWAITTPDAISTSPLLTTNGVLYFGGWDGRFYAVQADAGLAATPWPLFRANVRRTGSLAPEGRPPAVAATLPPPPPPPEAEPEIILPPVRQPTFTNRAAPPPIRFTDITSTPRELILSNQTVVVKPLTPPQRPPAERIRNDRTPPKINLRSPEPRVRLTNPLLVITGTARDNEGLARVEYQLDQNDLQAAEGLGEWTIRQQVTPGAHRVRVRAVDLAGLVSDWVEVQCEYVLASPLLLQIVGQGEVTPNLSRDLLEIGRTYTLTAKPERGWTFARWTGGVNSEKTTLEFVMRSNLVLIANFVPKTTAPKEAPDAPPAETPERPSLAVTVTVSGAGTVTPDTRGRKYTAGKTLSLQARANPGHRFAGWRGSVTSSDAELHLLLRSNMTLEAVFEPGPFVERQGAYAGLAWVPSAVGLDNSGLAQFEVDTEGHYQGRLWWSGQAHVLRGQFDADGRARQLLARSGETTLAFELSLTYQMPGAPPQALLGWVRDGEWTSPLTARRAARRLPEGLAAGAYTAALVPRNLPPQVQGDGWLLLRLAPPHQVTLAGRLPDGTPLEAKTVLGEDGHCPVYLPLYGGRGALLGWCQWDPQKNPPLTGQLAWFKPPSPKDKLLPAGAAGLLIVCGQRAEPSRPGRPAWTAPQAVLAFTGGQLPETLGSVLEWDERGRPRFALAAYEKMEFRLDPEHGLFEGAFTHPTTRKSTVFQGVWLPQMGWGSGCFVDGETIGLVSLTPATNALPAAAEAAAGQAPAPSRPRSK